MARANGLPTPKRPPPADTPERKLDAIARAVVNGNKIGVGADLFESGFDRKSARRPTARHGAQFGDPVDFLNVKNGVYVLGTRHDHDFRHRSGILKGEQGVSQHGLSVEREERF